MKRFRNVLKPILASSLLWAAASSTASAQDALPDGRHPVVPLDVATACPNARDVVSAIVYPIAAVRAGVSNADIAVGFSIAPSGEPTDIVVKATNQPYFDETIVAAVRRLRCPGVPLGMKLEWHVALRVTP
jgi:outer membrane biosynthesis protein TonB